VPVTGSSATSSSETPAPTHPTICLQHGIQKPKTYTDGTICYANIATIDESPSLQDALSDNKWKQAMDVEFTALMKAFGSSTTRFGSSTTREKNQ
jgi:hypothetical protein